MSDREKSAPAKNFLAGGAGGICIVLVGQPFDTIKVRVQAMPVATVGKAQLYKGPLDCVKKTIANEGVLALYKGMAAPLVGVAPIFALYFFGTAVGRQLQQKHPDEQLNLFQLFNAGALAGVFTTGVMAPGERIKCLLQVQQGVSPAERQYKGPVDVVRKLYREGGIRSLYKGTMATLLRDIPASGAYLATYEGMKRVLNKDDDAASMSSVTAFAKILLSGGTAGIVNWSVCLPQDVLKSRLQTAPEGKYSGIRAVFKDLMKTEGPTALFKGFTPVMLRAFPANAACFLGYEVALKVLGTLGL